MSDLNKVTLLKPLNILVFVDNQQHSKTKSNGDYLINLNDPLEIDSKLIKKSNSFSDDYCDQLFSSIQNFLTFYLSQNFTIYPISLDELNKGAWINSTKLLIIIQNDFNNGLEYLEHIRNKMINQFQQETNSVIILNHQSLVSSDDQNLENLNLDVLKESIKMRIGSEYAYENFSIPEPTTHYVHSEVHSQTVKLIDYLSRIGLRANSYSYQQRDVDFDINKYLGQLNSDNRLGRAVIVSNVTKSTQPIAEGSPMIDGLVVITNQQTEGKGRGKNQWLSPTGSISFSYAVKVPLHSKLFSHLAFFQHLDALAILLAIKKFNRMDELDLKIKWPNDIYYKEKHKLVGILSNSTYEGDSAKFFIGNGINLLNSKPTFSLKNIVEEDLKIEFTVTKEELIAEILNQVNQLIKIVNNQGKDALLDLYLKNWMMKDKIIQLSNGKNAIVRDLDEDGYLRVSLIDDGEIVSLLPDGNSFDILFGLKEFKH